MFYNISPRTCHLVCSWITFVYCILLLLLFLSFLDHFEWEHHFPSKESAGRTISSPFSYFMFNCPVMKLLAPHGHCLCRCLKSIVIWVIFSFFLYEEQHKHLSSWLCCNFNTSCNCWLDIEAGLWVFIGCLLRYRTQKCPSGNFSSLVCSLGYFFSLTYFRENVRFWEYKSL